MPLQTSSADIALGPAPITPAWVRAGAPIARAAELSRSADGTSFTVIWDCTAGEFDWHYRVDETLQVLEGHAILQEPGKLPIRLGPGDVAFCPRGTTVHWHVECYIKKVAFLREIIPNPIRRPYTMLRHLRHRLRTALRPRSATPAQTGASIAGFG
jgi:uncharacterized cupin superfamily protein